MKKTEVSKINNWNLVEEAVLDEKTIMGTEEWDDLQEVVHEFSQAAMEKMEAFGIENNPDTTFGEFIDGLDKYLESFIEAQRNK